MRISVTSDFIHQPGIIKWDPICGASNLMVPMYGKFEVFPINTVD